MNNPIFDLNEPFTQIKPQVEGLTYIPGFIDDKLHNRLLEIIHQETWRNDLKRRVQHYGYVYDYRSRSINKAMYLGELPKFCAYFAQKFKEAHFFQKLPDQVIVNEYLAGQGISPHVDCEPCFEDTVISMSLGATCMMDFTNVENPDIKFQQILHPKSIVILQGDARYKWKHGIAAKKFDLIDGVKKMRETRISLTFRKVIL